MHSKSSRALALLRHDAEILSYRSWNVDAKVENAKVNSATGTLVVMRSVIAAAHAQINQDIPNFPATPDAVTVLPGTLLFPYFLFQANVLRRPRLSRPLQSP